MTPASTTRVRALTKDLVRELLDYHPRKGSLVWKHRDRRHFNSDASHKRWNAMHAGQEAFRYVGSSGYRWGSIFGENMLAHRVVWLWVHGHWPASIRFRDGDGTNIKLANLFDEGQPIERVRIAA